MGRFFLFREFIPGETSPVTWGLKRQRTKGQVLRFPSLQVTTCHIPTTSIKFFWSSADSEPPNYLRRPSASKLFLSPHSHVVAGHDHSSNNRGASLYFAPRRYRGVESFDSAITNPDRANVRPIGTNPNRAREQPMRTGPVAWLSGIQVAEGEVLHGSRQDRRGPHFTCHAIPDPPPPY
jgi:hypothetical protein